ncbi:MAG: pyridoxal-phosphate dependent enzyme [Bdellovibrionales bacterium]|nr:pyridoxal-phosphate dependent enzyme [Bdellovibrionales bacterium]
MNASKHTSVTIDDIREAQKRIAPYLFKTPLSYSHSLSRKLDRDIFIKWDNKLRTGSFKERGALNFLLQLSPEEKNRGVIAASAGNHALAVAWHAKQLGIPCSIVMPTTAPLVKMKTSSSFGAEVSLVGSALHESYAHALELADQSGQVFVPGYDHPHIIAGAGVSGLEILEDWDDFDAVVVPLGGGGLLAGISRAIRGSGKDTYLLGVRSQWTKEMGKPKAQFSPAPIADGIAVKDVGALPKEIIDSDVNKVVHVEEKTIATAITSYLHEERTVVEGAGAAALAALLEDALPKQYQRLVLLACGSNIDLNILARLIQRSQFKNGQLLRVRVSVPDRPGSLARLTQTISEQAANVLETYHERSFSAEPGNVEITFLLETRDEEHKGDLMRSLASSGLHPHEL